MYIYNRVICMDFPETYMAYMALFFFFSRHISLILTVFFPGPKKNSRNTRVIGEHSKRRTPLVDLFGTRSFGQPRCAQWDRNIYLHGCHVYMVNVGKDTSAMEHMGRVIG